MTDEDNDPSRRTFHYEGDIPVFETRLSEVERKATASEIRDEQYKNSQRRINLWLAVFTGLLVLTSLISGGISIWQARIANKSANAAKQSAEISGKQFEVAERPQLFGDKMFLVGPIVIDRNGIRLDFKITFTNKGPTRAVKTFGAAEVFPLQITGPEPAVVRDRVCKRAEEIADSHSGITLTVYPGQQQEIAFGMPINRREMDEAVQRTGFIVPAIVACIAYRPFFNDTSVYHTGFAEMVTYAPDSAHKRKVISPQDGTIPLGKLDLHETGVTPEISPD